MSGQSAVDGPSRQGKKWHFRQKGGALWGILVLLWIGLELATQVKGHEFGGNSWQWLLGGQKKSITLKAKSWEPIHSFKLKGPLRVKLSQDDSDQAIVTGRPFVLKAEISSAEDLAHLQIKWVLPPGIRLEQGELVSNISFISAHRPEYLVLRLLAEEEGNQQIHLMISGEKNGSIFGESVQFNTLDQNLIELENEELARRSKEKMKVQDSSRRLNKIFY